MYKRSRWENTWEYHFVLEVLASIEVRCIILQCWAGPAILIPVWYLVWLNLGKLCCFGVLGCFMLQEYMSFPVILCSGENWVSFICRGKAEVRKAEVTCPGVTCWTCPGEVRWEPWPLDGALICFVVWVKHTLCCLLCIFRNKFPKLLLSSQGWELHFHLGPPWNGWILSDSRSSWRMWGPGHTWKSSSLLLSCIWSCKVISFWGAAA